MTKTGRAGIASRGAQVGALLALALVLTACSSGAPDPGATGNKQSAGASSAGSASSTAGENALPAEIRDRGYVNVAGDASYPPIGFMGKDGTTMEGLDSELADALGKVLGIEFKHENTSFDAIIPGLQGNKFDMGMSWINDTEVRRQVVDFIDYSKDGSSILVLAAGSNKPTSLDALCGLAVAVQKGTAQQTDVTDQSAKCEQSGKAKIDLQTYPDQSAANLALMSGRADATIADTPVAVWQQDQTKGKLVVSGPPYGAVNHGIALPKGSKLVAPVAAAMQSLLEDGTYAKILAKWGMSDAAIDKVLINGEPLS